MRVCVCACKRVCPHAHHACGGACAGVSLSLGRWLGAQGPTRDSAVSSSVEAAPPCAARRMCAASAAASADGVTSGAGNAAAARSCVTSQVWLRQRCTVTTACASARLACERCGERRGAGSAADQRDCHGLRSAHAAAQGASRLRTPGPARAAAAHSGACAQRCDAALVSSGADAAAAELPRSAHTASARRNALRTAGGRLGKSAEPFYAVTTHVRFVADQQDLRPSPPSSRTTAHAFWRAQQQQQQRRAQGHLPPPVAIRWRRPPGRRTWRPSATCRAATRRTARRARRWRRRWRMGARRCWTWRVFASCGCARACVFADTRAFVRRCAAWKRS